MKGKPQAGLWNAINVLTELIVTKHSVDLKYYLEPEPYLYLYAQINLSLMCTIFRAEEGPHNFEKHNATIHHITSEGKQL